jgi:hypothetical protein
MPDDGLRREPTFLGPFFVIAGVGHLLFGVVGLALPRWFYATVPPWPPLHVGQIQIAGVFDLALATAFLVAAADVDRFAPLMLPVGVVAEWGHAAVRVGHIVAGDNPAADWQGPLTMIVFGAVCLAALVRHSLTANEPTSGRSRDDGPTCTS